MYIPNSISKRLNNLHCIFTIQYQKKLNNLHCIFTIQYRKDSITYIVYSQFNIEKIEWRYYCRIKCIVYILIKLEVVFFLFLFFCCFWFGVQCVLRKRGLFKECKWLLNCDISQHCLLSMLPLPYGFLKSFSIETLWSEIYCILLIVIIKTCQTSQSLHHLQKMTVYGVIINIKYLCWS